MCYGGGFAASAASIEQLPPTRWARLGAALERGESVEEGHVTTLALALAQPLIPHPHHY